MRELCSKNQKIDRVYYFDDNGVFGYEKLNTMNCTKFSRGYERFCKLC